LTGAPKSNVSMPTIGAEAKRQLGNVSVSTLLRLEKAGILDPIKLNPALRNGKTFYTPENLTEVANGRALAEGEADGL